jgi:isopentenyl-diphosphate delta-isomerase
LELFELPYNALTQTNPDEIDLTTDFLGSRLRPCWSAR